MENILESVILPEEETRSQETSEMCIDMKYNTILPLNIVTGMTIQLPKPSFREQQNVTL